MLSYFYPYFFIKKSKIHLIDFLIFVKEQLVKHLYFDFLKEQKFQDKSKKLKKPKIRDRRNSKRQVQSNENHDLKIKLF